MDRTSNGPAREANTGTGQRGKPVKRCLLLLLAVIVLALTAGWLLRSSAPRAMLFAVSPQGERLWSRTVLYPCQGLILANNGLLVVGQRDGIAAFQLDGSPANPPLMGWVELWKQTRDAAWRVEPEYFDTSETESASATGAAVARELAECMQYFRLNADGSMICDHSLQGYISRIASDGTELWRAKIPPFTCSCHTQYGLEVAADGTVYYFGQFAVER